MPCQACRRDVPTKYVEFYQNIGMLVLRSLRSIKGNLCRRCIKHYFWQLTGLTLLTGWWGMISFIMNPFLILNNIIRYVGSLGLADGDDQAFAVAGPTPLAGAPAPAAAARASPLASYRQDISMRLRGGQSTQEIVAYLAPRAGVNTAAAAQFVDSIRKTGR